AIADALALSPPPILAKAPGTLAFEGLYLHSIAGVALPQPEHRWLKRQSDGSVAVVSDVPFMESIYYAEGGKNQGFTRYEIECWGDSSYNQRLEFEPGGAIVTLPGLGAEWERRNIPVPLRALFLPNSRPDPYSAAQVLESVLT